MSLKQQPAKNCWLRRLLTRPYKKFAKKRENNTTLYAKALGSEIMNKKQNKIFAAVF